MNASRTTARARRWRATGLAGFALAAAPCVGHAAQVGGPSLAEMFASAVERSPEIAVAAGALLTAERRSHGAERWYKGAPRLTASTVDDAFADDRGYAEQELGVGAQVWLPGERRAARRAADAGLDLARAELMIARLDLAARVREACWEAALADQLLQVELAGVRRDAATREAVARLVDAREVPPNDLRLADAALAMSRQAAAVAVTRADRAAADLAQLTGHARPPAVVETAPPDPEVPVADAAALENHPAYQAASSRRSMLEWAARSAAKDAGDSPEVTLLARRERVLDGAPIERSLGIQLVVPLQRSAAANVHLAELSSAAHSARLQAERVRDDLPQRFRLSRQAVVAARSNAEHARVRRDALATVAAALLTAYDAGETSFLELQRSRAELLAAERSLVEAEVEAGRAHSAWRTLHGQLP